jgi:hypothetical protein
MGTPSRSGSCNRASATISASAVKAVPRRVFEYELYFIALWAPFPLACANHNDKFLLSRYLRTKTVGSIVIPSSLFSGVAVLIVLIFQPDVIEVTLFQGFALIATRMSSVFAAVCYLYALDMDEASFVTPFYQQYRIGRMFVGGYLISR